MTLRKYPLTEDPIINTLDVILSNQALEVIDFIFFGNNQYLAYAIHEGSSFATGPNNKNIKVVVVQISNKIVINSYFPVG